MELKSLGFYSHANKKAWYIAMCHLKQYNDKECLGNVEVLLMQYQQLIFQSAAADVHQS